MVCIVALLALAFGYICGLVIGVAGVLRKVIQGQVEYNGRTYCCWDAGPVHRKATKK